MLTFALLAPRAAQAQFIAAEQDANYPGFQDLFQNMSDTVAPLSKTYLDRSRFELDPMQSELFYLDAGLQGMLARARPNPQCAPLTQTPTSGPWRMTLSLSADAFRLFSPATLLWTGQPVDMKTGMTIWNEGFSKPLDVYSFEGLCRQYFNAHPDDFMKLDPESLQKKMKDEFESYFSDKSPWNQEYWKRMFFEWSDQQRNLKALAANRFLFARTDAEWQTALKQASKVLTFEEQIELTRKVGGILGEKNYNFDRAKMRVDGGAVLPMTLIDALRRGDTAKAGVCRDYASFQGQMLEAMGFKNVYVVTHNAGVLHATVIAQNDKAPGKVLKFNYSSFDQAENSEGVRALSQRDDVSSHYWISKTAGETVAVLPTELRLAIAKANGENLRDIDVFSRDTTPGIASMKFSRDGQDDLAYRAFMGRLSNGKVFVGIGLEKLRIRKRHRFCQRFAFDLSRRRSAAGPIHSARQSRNLLGKDGRQHKCANHGAIEARSSRHS